MDKIKINFFIIPIVALFCSIAILVGIYPYRPNSTLSWVVLYSLSIPIVVIGEYLGDRLLGNKYVSKLTRPMRIAYGVIAISILIILSTIILNSADPILTKWGT